MAHISTSGLQIKKFMWKRHLLLSPRAEGERVCVCVCPLFLPKPPIHFPPFSNSAQPFPVHSHRPSLSPTATIAVMADPRTNGTLPPLTTPLLSQSRDGESEQDRESTDEVVLDVGVHAGWDGEESENPYQFMGAPRLSLPPPCPIDPFRNHTPSLLGAGLYEWLKILVCVPIALARLVLFGLALLVGFSATKLALLGWKDKQNPMPRWRCRIMWVTRICARCILFSFGYHWIKRIGRPSLREIAPIVVSNHVSYIEPIFFFYELFPTMVASESHDSIPFVGTIIRAMQVIYVNRFSAPSRKYAVNEIKRKASCNNFPRVLLFSEGTTTNGRVLISFQLGAFIPGLPIQPVVIRYPHVHFDQSWGNISLMKLMFRMFTQFHNFMEVEYLSVVNPPPIKIENAIRFAEKTSYAIASALNVVQTCHSYGDLMLVTKASEITKGKPSAYLVEMAWVRSTFNISTMEAMEFLDKFLSMNPDANGRVKVQIFLAAYKLGPGPLAEKIFDFIDVENKGSITFRQFLLGSAHIMNQPSFHHICESIFDAYSRGTGSFSIEQLTKAIPSATLGTSNERVSELFHLIDVNKNGLVNRNDFMTFMRRNPLMVALFVAQLKYTGSIEIV